MSRQALMNDTTRAAFYDELEKISGAGWEALKARVRGLFRSKPRALTLSNPVNPVGAQRTAGHRGQWKAAPPAPPATGKRPTGHLDDPYVGGRSSIYDPTVPLNPAIVRANRK